MVFVLFCPSFSLKIKSARKRIFLPFVCVLCPLYFPLSDFVPTIFIVICKLVPTTHHHCDRLLIYHRNIVTKLLFFVWLFWFESRHDVVETVDEPTAETNLDVFKMKFIAVEVYKYRTSCLLLLPGAKAVERYKRETHNYRHKFWTLCVGMWSNEFKSLTSTLYEVTSKILFTATKENVSFSP